MAKEKSGAGKSAKVDPTNSLVNQDQINAFREQVPFNVPQEIAREHLSQFVHDHQVNGHTLVFLEEIVDECDPAGLEDSNG